MGVFKDKTLMITGGTGSFGNAVLDKFLCSDVREIRIFSRDEKKQDDMRHEYQAKYPEQSEKIKFYIGDVRDIGSVRNAMHDVDYLFHAAALKQVPSCEFFPIEAVKTNVLGTENVLTAAAEAGVRKIVCLSTDKAAYPVNAMGTSKAMMEKVIIAKSRTISPEKTQISCTRYGNVLCSRGSVVPLFISQIKAGGRITVTEPKMTRFIMSLEEAVELVLYAFEHAESGDIMVQKAPACTIGVLAQAVSELFGYGEEPNIIGIRHGEKMYETLLTNEECAHALDLGNFFRVPVDKRDLNYDKYIIKGDTQRNKLQEFNSNNTRILDVEEVKKKLLRLPYIQAELAGWRHEVGYWFWDASGMAGHVITIRLEELGHEVEGYAREHLTYCRTTAGNAKDMQALRQLVQSGSYDYVVNAIGILNQDAEKRKTDAIYLNSLLPHALAEMTENLPTRVIHISTDCVFGGNTGPYREDALPDGRMFYDRTKALGELWDDKNLTIRTSIVGPDRRERGIGLFNWFMQAGK